MNQPQQALSPRRRNTALPIGFLFLLLAIASNVPALYGIAAARGILPWVNLLLPTLAMIFCLVGVTRAFAKPQMFRGKIAGSILAVIAVLFFALSVWGYNNARSVPGSAHAPKVGDKAPDFTLTNTGGQAVTLAQLLAAPIDTASGKVPKAVLLVFYRGYW